MSGHKDAAGHLLSLRNDITFPWFSLVCDLALAANDATLTESQTKQVLSCFFGKEEYTPLSAPSPARPTTTISAPTAVARLKKLSHFTNFKKLSTTLNVDFEKRITLVFGTNGSGKSSICEAIKMMACPDAPKSPLKNVYGALTSEPSFAFRFECDASETAWESSKGFGHFSSKIKYFDSTVAVRHLDDAPRPEAVVEVAPFRLEVFDYCRSFVSHLRNAVDSQIQEAGKAINSEVSVLSLHFANIPDDCKTAITLLGTGDFSKLDMTLAGFTPPTAQETKAAEEAVMQLTRLKQANTQDGLRVLKVDSASLRRIHQTLNSFVSRCAKVIPESYRRLVVELRSKRAAQQAIAQDILSGGVTVDRFKAFLDSTDGIFVFPGAEGDPCPFCRRPLDNESVELVKRYHSFLLTYVLRSKSSPAFPSKLLRLPSSWNL